MVKRFQGFRYRDDLGLQCQYCKQEIVLVWGEGVPPEEAWTECEGVGEGSCNFRCGCCSECFEEGFEPGELHPETGWCKACCEKGNAAPAVLLPKRNGKVSP